MCRECAVLAISYKSFERKKALARRKVYSSDKKYRFSLFIGDSKTPIGEFSMTLSECKRKNLEYESKFIKSNDPTYRLRVLRLTTESKKEMGNDGAWGRWTTILTDANSLMLGATAETARAAIQSSVFPAHSKASMPPLAASINMGVIVSDAVGGRRPFWSDGTNWRDASGTILS